MATDSCRGALYCSENCAEVNANRHRKLCFKYKTAKHPDGGNHARAVLFPAGKPKPEILFVHVNHWNANVEHVVCAAATQPADSPVVTITMPVNPVTGRRLPFDLKITFRACTVPLNTALTFCFNDNWELPVPRFPWTGSISVVRVQQGTDIAEDITMADYKDVLDFFAWYAHHFTPEMFEYVHEYAMPAAAAPICGVMVRCAATEALGPEQGALVATMVDHLHPIRGLHTADGFKLTLSRTLLLRRARLAAELMVDMAAYAAAPMPPGPVSEFIPEIHGDVLLVREDGLDLAVDDVAAMCLEVRSWMSSVATQGQQPAHDLPAPNNYQHANAIGGPLPQVWKHDQTMPSLWTRVKTPGGWDNLAAAILFEGYSFQPPAFLGDAVGGEEYAVDREEYMERAEEQQEGGDQEMVYQYPSPPPRRYNYSADIMPESEVPWFEPMEE
ncbi:hypothetical protein C8A01DRAFT_45258 [Parachaetomium inaequale]|uniref:Uncharacterized protein n=1 Tax=Parachaetomium inaequale TaxID=2588326 RepID=A0AAN6PKF9_9PEZI|nr:hypothetical protein C8A01DRAFT_45258 [Parachaetomium inaequale]